MMARPQAPSRPAAPARAQRLRAALRVLRHGALAAGLVGGVLFIAGLAEEARQEFLDLRTAGLDNMQWTASQLEVDVLRLLVESQRALLQAGSSGDTLAPIRTRYDILHSRADILTRGAIYEAMAGDDAVIAALQALRAFLEAYEPVIDGPDADLAAALEQLTADVRRLHGDTRPMVLRVIDRFSLEADAQRAGLAALLMRIAVVTAALLAVLTGLLALLGRLYRRQQRAQAELRVARDAALAGQRAKTSFIAVMSHEMRTPLNGIIASLEIVRDDVREPKQAQFVALAHSSALQLMHQINDVLDISKIEAGRLEIAEEDFMLAAFLEGIVGSVRPLAEARGNAVVLRLAPGLPKAVRGDSFRLRQILQNFLSNAIKFTERGRIELAAAAAPGGGIEFSVTDTGVGIAPEDLERVFEDFVMLDPTYSREVGGSGLGLAICRRLATAMAGRIGAESTPGAGSRFWLRLPLPAADAGATAVGAVVGAAVGGGPFSADLASVPRSAGASPPGVAPAAAPGAAGLHVLVVDDNAVNRTVIAQMLADDGHRPHLACNGREAVAIARETAFDVILMDISMPEMDGVTAARRIREGGRSADAPIFALTAHAMPEELARFEAAGLRTGLLKPVRREAMRAALAGFARRGDAPAPVTVRADAAAGDPAVLPLIDPAAIRDHAEILGPEALAAIREQFAADAARLIPAMARAAADGDADALRRHAHELKGAAATLGLARLSDMLLRIEAAARDGVAEDIDPVLGVAHGLLSESLAVLEQFSTMSSPDSGPLRRRVGS